MIAQQTDLLPRVQVLTAEWREVNKGHRRLVELADHHYTRQKPGTPSCTRPGVNLCLLLTDGTAAWVVWRPIPEVGRKDNLECWECTLFRNEGARLSSELIAEATAKTFRIWGWPPRDGFITAIGVEQTQRRRGKSHLPGHCYRMAGWTPFQHPNTNPEKAWLIAPHPMRVERVTH